MSIIDCQKIEKDYVMAESRHRVLQGIDLQVKSGEMMAIMGPSGSGKSTLMHILGLLDHPTNGYYRLGGCLVDEMTEDERASLRNQMIGFVFQSFFLLPRLSVWQNVVLPLRYAHNDRASEKQLAAEMLKKFEVEDKLNYFPNQLSGGQQQRVAIARALICQPKILLADEPTGALDSKTSQQVMALLKQINQQMQTTVIIITHDHQVAGLCPRIVEINDGRLQS